MVAYLGHELGPVVNCRICCCTPRRSVRTHWRDDKSAMNSFYFFPSIPASLDGLVYLSSCFLPGVLAIQRRHLLQDAQGQEPCEDTSWNSRTSKRVPRFALRACASL